MQKMTWFERTTSAMWHNASPSDSLYETGSQGCLAIILGTIVAAVAVILVLAGRVRRNTKTRNSIKLPATSVSST